MAAPLPGAAGVVRPLGNRRRERGLMQTPFTTATTRDDVLQTTHHQLLWGIRHCDWIQSNGGGSWRPHRWCPRNDSRSSEKTRVWPPLPRR